MLTTPATMPDFMFGMTIAEDRLQPSLAEGVGSVEKLARHREDARPEGREHEGEGRDAAGYHDAGEAEGQADVE